MYNQEHEKSEAFCKAKQRCLEAYQAYQTAPPEKFSETYQAWQIAWRAYFDAEDNLST